MLQIVEPRNQNHLHVRKYYKTHRRDIIQHKIKRSCQLYGRVPRMNTVLEHELPLTELIDAFKEWLATRDPDDKQCAKRSARFREMVRQLHDHANCT